MHGQDIKVTHAANFSFGIQIREEGIVYLSAATLEDREDWIKCLQKCSAENGAVARRLVTQQSKLGMFRSMRSVSKMRRVEIKRQVRALQLNKVALEYKWTKELVVDYKNKSKADIESYCFVGIPKNLRGMVWSVLLGNELQINENLYNICKQRAMGVLGEMKLRDEVRQAAVRVAKEEEEMVEVHGADPVQVAKEVFLLSEDLIAAGERNIKLLNVDIPRTFAHHSFFTPGEIGHERLRTVLEAYTCYRPDLGYVQGMSYLAATLCFHMDAFSAFKALASLLAGRLLFDMYRLEESRVGI